MSVNETVIAKCGPWISRVGDSYLDLWAVQGPLGCPDFELQGWELKAAADFSVPSEFDWERWSAVTKWSKIAGNSV